LAPDMTNTAALFISGALAPSRFGKSIEPLPRDGRRTTAQVVALCLALALNLSLLFVLGADPAGRRRSA